MDFETSANLASAKIFSESVKQKLRPCNPFEGKPMLHLQPANFTAEIDLRGETLIYCEG